MKQYTYNISVFLFLIISNSFAQTKELVLREQFKTDKNTLLNIDIDNATIQFKESLDNTIRFDYSIIFNDNSEELKYKVFKNMSANASKTKNIVSLDVKNGMLLGERHSINVDFNSYKEYIKDYFKQSKANQFLYKSKDAVLNEIDFSLGNSIEDYFKRLKNKYPDKKLGDGVRKFKQQFIIRVPKNIRIKMKALHSIVSFDYNVDKQFEINSFKTNFKFKKIEAKENRIIASNGIFQAQKVTNARVEFLDMNKVLIGEVTNAEFATETSKIEIGEVGKNVVFNDFNSKINLYNFTTEFNQFNYKGEYSKLYFYKITESNYKMTVFGQNTALNMNETKTTFGLSKDKKLTKILEKKVKKDKTSSGNINIELINGILNLKE